MTIAECEELYNEGYVIIINDGQITGIEKGESDNDEL